MTVSASVSPQSDERRRLTVVIISYLIFVVLGMPDGMLGVAFPAMRREFSLTLDAFGLIFVSTTVGFLVSSFLVGSLLNRFHTAHFLIAAGLLRTVGLVVYSLIPSYGMVVAAALIVGLASGMIDAGMNTWFAMRFSPRLMNWLHAAFGLGATLAPLVVTQMLDADISWRWGFVLMAVLQVGTVAAVVATRPLWAIAPTVVPTEQRQEGKPHISTFQTLLIPAVWIGIAVFFFYTGVELTAANWSTTIFTEGRGIDLRTAGYAATAFWLTFTLGRIFFGFVTPRSISTLLRACMVGALAGALFLAWAPWAWVGFAGLVVIGFSVAPVFPLLVSETPLRLGAEVAQHAIGFQVGAASLGIAVLPSLAGVVAQRSTVEAIPLFLIAVAIVLILLHEWMIRLHPAQHTN